MVKETGIYWTNEEKVIVKSGSKEYIDMQPTAKSLCVIDGVGFGVTPEGFTYCAGKVRDASTERHQTARQPQDSVSKPITSSLPNTKISHTQNDGGFETPKNTGGRPRKPDDQISRTTRWRREIERQGTLL